MNRPIAVFDSGVGGFTVVKDIMRMLPYETIVYVGDTARAPYGNREVEEIQQFSYEICQYLMTYDPKLIVIACNTATALALDYLRDSFSIPIIGVIEPGVRAAIQSSPNRKIGVIGTEATINSGAYEQMLKKIDDSILIISHPCPSFVPIVEQDKFDSDEAVQAVTVALKEIKVNRVNSLILGCTHYPFLRRVIQHELGMEVKLIHSGYETAKQVKATLLKNSFINDNENKDAHVFVCSGSLALFSEIGKKWLANQLYNQSCEWKVM